MAKSERTPRQNKPKQKESFSQTGVWTKETAETSHVFSQELAEAILPLLTEGTPVLDLGAGNGSYAGYFTKKGFKVVAVDGQHIETEKKYEFVKADLSEDLVMELAEYTVLSLEVGEHIPKEHEKTFFSNLVKYAGQKIILSWAVPGQGGIGHVNEKFNTSVIRQMQRKDFAINAQQTKALRRAVVNDKDAWWFIDSIMVFDRISS